MFEKRRGHYLGTEIDGKWWCRYRKDGFLARGLGEYWIENSLLYIHRYLTVGPIVISLCDVSEELFFLFTAQAMFDDPESFPGWVILRRNWVR